MKHSSATATKPLNFRRPVLFGWALIIVGLGGFLVWSATAPLDSAVRAPGVVAVESKRKLVQHLEGGIVRKLLVREGDWVTSGQSLIQLDDTKARSVVEVLRSELDAYQMEEARLQAEREGKDDFLLPESFHTRQDDPEIKKNYQGQLRIFRSRRESLAGQRDILNQKITQYRERITGLEAQEQSRKEQITLYQEELLGLRKLAQEGNVPQNYVLEKERDLSRLKGEQGQYLAEVALSRQGIAESELRVLQLDKDIHGEIDSRLSELRKEIASLNERMVAAEDVLARHVIRAPVDGQVIGLSAHTEGGVILAGRDIMQVVPQGDELVIEAQVAPTDIDDVAKGLRAVVRMVGLSYRNNPLIEGEVITVSADALTDAQSGRSFFSARIQIPPEQLHLLGDQKMQPGMPVEVLIKTGSRTALDYILTPFETLVSHAFIEK